MVLQQCVVAQCSYVLNTRHFFIYLLPGFLCSVLVSVVLGGGTINDGSVRSGDYCLITEPITGVKQWR